MSDAAFARARHSASTQPKENDMTTTATKATVSIPLRGGDLSLAVADVYGERVTLTDEDARVSLTLPKDLFEKLVEVGDVVTIWEHTKGEQASDVEPVDVGWYAYSGGAQSMIFHLRETGQWSVHLSNGTAADCAWGYIQQALGVWDLVPLAPPAPTPAKLDGAS